MPTPSIKTLCVNGWAQQPDGLSIIAEDALHFDYRPYASLDEAAKALGDIAPQAETAIGWSLGGAILQHAIGKGFISVSRLVLLAPVVQFVANETFSHGMDAWTFSQFQENYRTDPARTASRFLSLIAKGDAQIRKILQEHLPWAGSRLFGDWNKWLNILAERKSDDFINYRCESIVIIHGNNDLVVSINSSLWLKERLPDIKLEVIENCGHAPHWHNSERIRALIEAPSRG